MADTRTYIRVHDGMDEHPKIEGLSDPAFRLLFRCWFWCSRNLTDGRIPAASWRQRGTARTRRELVDAGLVEDHGDHVLMHDYLEHQRSAAEVAALREKRSESGRKGGRARAQAQASAKQTLEQTEGDAQAVSVSEADPSLRSGGRAQRATRLPGDFAVTGEMRQWATEQGWAAGWIDHVTERFVDYWRAKAGRDGTKTDWVATWRNWLRREAENGRPLAAVGAGAGRQVPPWEL